MDTTPALLLLLALRFCCPGVYAQSLKIKVRSPVDITQLRMGQELKLECQIDKPSGAFWIHQDKSGTLHFIVFISSIAKTTFEGNQKTSHWFMAGKDNNIYWLAVRFFKPQDEGNYFCMVNFNQMLYFSPGQPAFLPATLTVAHITCRPTSKCGIIEEPNLSTPDPEGRMQQDLDQLCLVFLWVPFAGLCLLLLQLMANTIVLRRRKAQHFPL